MFYEELASPCTFDAPLGNNLCNAHTTYKGNIKVVDIKGIPIFQLNKHTTMIILSYQSKDTFFIFHQNITSQIFCFYIVYTRHFLKL